jgi:hypothetical protein
MSYPPPAEGIVRRAVQAASRSHVRALAAQWGIHTRWWESRGRIRARCLEAFEVPTQVMVRVWPSDSWTRVKEFVLMVVGR